MEDVARAMWSMRVSFLFSDSLFVFTFTWLWLVGICHDTFFFFFFLLSRILWSILGEDG